jgi:hypothetical protein
VVAVEQDKSALSMEPASFMLAAVAAVLRAIQHPTVAWGALAVAAMD